MAPTYPFSETDALVLDPTYERLRREEPVTRVTYPYGGEGWLVTSYEETKFVLGDARFSRARTVDRDVPRMQPLIAPGRSILTTDGADHTRLRRLVSKAFTVRRIEELRPRAADRRRPARPAGQPRRPRRGILDAVPDHGHLRAARRAVRGPRRLSPLVAPTSRTSSPSVAQSPPTT